MRNKFIVAAGVVIALLIAGYLYNKYRVAPEINFGTLNLTNAQGEEVQLENYKSRTLLICFFATWCGPCIQEIPSLEKAHGLLKGEDVTIILVSDESEATLNTFWQKNNDVISVLRSKQKLSELKIATVPTAYVLNQKREIVFKKTGGTDWASAEMIEKLKELSR